MRGRIPALLSTVTPLITSILFVGCSVGSLVGCGTQGFQTASPTKAVGVDGPGAAATPDQTLPGGGGSGSGGGGGGANSELLIERYQQRYATLNDTHTKLVDNKGNGYEKLYGVRNLRAVLNGVVYRGGANNSYNKYGKRDNRNPLPNVGLENLCKEGFSNAVYLYSTNFSTAPKSWSCSSFHSEKSTLTYAQTSPYNDAGLKSMFAKIMTTIKDPSVGPVYLHCWNGWHASGLVSALILRQFCNYSGDQAVSYWDLNTDGANTDPAFVKIRKQIRDFKAFPEFKIDARTQALVCAGN